MKKTYQRCIRCNEYAYVYGESLTCGTCNYRLQQKWLRIKNRVRLINKDSVCGNCGTSENLTIDHITPLSRGGTNDLTNLQILCNKCNSSKGSKPLWQGVGISG